MLVSGFLVKYQFYVLKIDLPGKILKITNKIVIFKLVFTEFGANLPLSSQLSRLNAKTLETTEKLDANPTNCASYTLFNLAFSMVY